MRQVARNMEILMRYTILKAIKMLIMFNENRKGAFQITSFIVQVIYWN